MSKNYLETKNIKLFELLSNGKSYSVPQYQRDYSWNTDQWEDLLEDIYRLTDDDLHYMGTIVLQFSDDGKEMVIIDGQQRITTLSILIVSVISILKDLISQNIDKEENLQRIKALETYVCKQSASTLVKKPRLQLNDHNNSFFHQYVINLEILPSEVRKKSSSSNQLIYKSLVFFKEKLMEYFIQNKIEKNAEKIVAYIEMILEKICFIQIAVEDELNAYTLFETLNARGVELTATDLLKNYLFSLSDSESIKIMQIDWRDITERIKNQDMPRFLRYYINSHQDFITESQLFKTISRQIKNGAEAYSFIQNLKRFCIIYRALRDSEDDLWKEAGEFLEIKKRLEELKLFKMQQHIPLLMSAYDKIFPKKPHEFVRILEICSVIVFRYVVIGKRQTKDMEKAFNKCSIKIANEEISTAREVFENLKKLYIDDETFEKEFSSRSINFDSNPKLIYYILEKLECQFANTKNKTTGENISVEHILPKTMTEYWEQYFSFEEHEHFVSRLGNFVLLDRKVNRDLGQKDYPTKCEVFAKSPFAITSQIITNNKYREWNPQNIRKNQEIYAKHAKQIWKLSF